MPWEYSQSSGKLTRGGVFIATGYSGAPEGKNDPLKAALHNVGPIPQGRYTIGAVRMQTESHGPYVLPLTPASTNQMFGRSGFLVHGDSKKTQGRASQGCIILSRSTREAIYESGDRNLTVVA